MSATIAKSLAATVAILLPVSALRAQERDAKQSDNHIVVGVGVLDQHTPFKGAPSQAIPIPFVSIKQGAFYWEGLETGITLDKDIGGVSPSLDVFVAARSPTGRDRQKVSADAGVRLSLKGGFGALSVEYRRDVSDRFNGSEVIGRYSHVFSAGRFIITPGIQASWLDRKAADYMYGVTAAQRARMISKARRVVLPVAPITDDALNVGGDLTVAFRLNARLSLIALVGGTYLDRSIYRSPAIDQKWEGQSGLGLSYRF